MEMYSHRTTLPPKILQKVKPSYKVYPKQNRSEPKQKRDQIKKTKTTKRLDPYRENYQQKISKIKKKDS